MGYGGVWHAVLRSSTFVACQPHILFKMDVNVDKSTGLPQACNSHLWLLEIGNAHQWPHHGTSPQLACKTK